MQASHFHTFKTHFIKWVYLSLIICLSIGCAGTSPEATQPSAPSTQSEQSENGFYTTADEMPQLIGGLRDLHRRATYPRSLRDTGIQGKVLITFIVNEKGKPRNIEVAQSLHPDADREAMRVVAKALFIPGKRDGQPVPVKMSLPITFRRMR